MGVNRKQKQHTQQKNTMKPLTKKTIRIALSGATGRMGRAVASVVQEQKRVFKITEVCPPLKKEWEADKIDGVIDFSLPELFSKTLKWSVEYKKPFVSGTTGFTVKEKKQLKEAAKKIPVFYESNMSLGIFLLKMWMHQFQKITSSLGKNIPFSIHLEDIHHKNKRDKPSGTAIKLKESFGKRLKDKVKVNSIRRGREFGIHSISFTGKEEKILVHHKALNRLVFARGALLALQWLVVQPPGLYTMEDFLSISE